MNAFTSGVNLIADWIMKISVLNMIWFLVNIPIALLLFMIFITPDPFSVFIILIPVLILSSLLLFPSITAVFSVTREWVIGNEINSIWKSFWTFFSKSYKKSLKLGLIMTIIWTVWALDLYYFWNESEVLTVFFILIGGLLVVYTLNTLSSFVHFDLSLQEHFKNGFGVTFGNPFQSLFVIFLNLVVIYLTVRFIFIVVFFSLSVISISSFFIFYRYTERVKSQLNEKRHH